MILKQVNISHFYTISEQAYKHEVYVCMSTCVYAYIDFILYCIIVDNIIRYRIIAFNSFGNVYS